MAQAHWLQTPAVLNDVGLVAWPLCASVPSSPHHACWTCLACDTPVSTREDCTRRSSPVAAWHTVGTQQFVASTACPAVWCQPPHWFHTVFVAQRTDPVCASGLFCLHVSENQTETHRSWRECIDGETDKSRGFRHSWIQGLQKAVGAQSQSPSQLGSVQQPCL